VAAIAELEILALVDTGDRGGAVAAIAELEVLALVEPGSLDDATVARIERGFGDEEAACVGLYQPQLARWQQEPLGAERSSPGASGTRMSELSSSTSIMKSS
jgi:hypothetical protein